MSCAGEPEAAPRPRGRTSISFGWSRAHLVFDGDEVHLDKPALTLASDLYAGKFTVTLAAGGTALGSLVTERATYDVGPGWIGAAGLSWRVLEEDPTTPYVVLSTVLGAVGATTARGRERGAYLGFDFRFGATVGKTFFGWLSPYTSARVFGGPVFWSEGGATKLGTDRFHVQGALGAVFLLPESLDFFVEGSPGGEQGAFGGLGWRY